MMKYISEFVKSHKGVTILIGLAVLYMIVFLTMVGTGVLTETSMPFELYRLILTLCSSMTAAAIFYVINVYVPTRRKNRIMKKYAKLFTEEKLVREFDILKGRIEGIENSRLDEEQALNQINLNCRNIKEAVSECIRTYSPVLSEKMMDAVNGILYDDFFYMISMKAEGSLNKVEISQILDDETGRNSLWERVKIIEHEAAEMQMAGEE